MPTALTFTCPYSAELPEDEGGCPESGSWEVQAAPDIDRVSGEEILRVPDGATLCPECERPGVADSPNTSVVIDADHHHARHKKWLARMAKLAAKGS